MSQKFRVWVTLLIIPFGAIFVLFAIMFGDGQSAVVFGLWGFIFLAAGCLLFLKVQHQLPWRVLGAAAFVAAVAYFASGYYFELPSRDRKNAGYVAALGIVGVYFAITGRSPFLPKAAPAAGPRPDEGKHESAPEHQPHSPPRSWLLHAALFLPVVAAWLFLAAIIFVGAWEWFAAFDVATPASTDPPRPVD